VILTVTLNVALDITYHLERVDWGHVNRVARHGTRAGGKGINVARVVTTLGHTATIAGFAGGATGEAIREEVSRSGIAHHLVAIAGESRRTVAVVEGGRTTLFNELGPEVSPDEWAEFRETYSKLLRDCGVVVLSGSLPPGLPADAYAVLVRGAREAGALTLVDTEGAALEHALAAHPDVVKPNVHEIQALSGRECAEANDVAAAARWLRDAGARGAVITRGADGMVASNDEGTWLGLPPERLTGNETGAGDAVAAALAMGLEDGRPWPGPVADAIAAGAAALMSPVAGDVDLKAYRRFRHLVRLQEV